MGSGSVSDSTASGRAMASNSSHINPPLLDMLPTNFAVVCPRL